VGRVATTPSSTSTGRYTAAPSVRPFDIRPAVYFGYDVLKSSAFEECFESGQERLDQRKQGRTADLEMRPRWGALASASLWSDEEHGFTPIRLESGSRRK